MTAPRLARRPALPRSDLSPQDIFAPEGLDGGDPDDSRPSVIVVDDQQPAELLIGRARLARHLRLIPHRTIAAFRVSPRNEEQRDAISKLDGWTTSEAYASGVSALHASGMPLFQIRACVKGAGHVSDLGRLISVFRETPDLFELADRSRGVLKLGHLLALARVSASQREELAREVLARRWSVPALGNRIARPPQSLDADIASLADRLRDSLQCDVEVVGAAESGEVRLSWYTPEQLQGLFLRLGSPLGPSGAVRKLSYNADSGKASKRWLSLAYVSSGEFQELFGHLLGPDSGFAQGDHDRFAN